jgi:hypothetical protein
MHVLLLLLFLHGDYVSLSTAPFVMRLPCRVAANVVPLHYLA